MTILLGKPGYSEEYKRYLICKEFGYTYEEYENLPSTFVDEISLIMNLEESVRKAEEKKQEAKNRISRPAIRRH